LCSRVCYNQQVLRVPQLTDRSKRVYATIPTHWDIALTPPDRTKRVKDARSEAQKEIEDYRKEKEDEFQKFEKEVRFYTYGYGETCANDLAAQLWQPEG